MKKKKTLVILIIIIALCAIAFIIWRSISPKAYEPEILEPEVFEEEVYDTDMLVGVWRSGSVYYRYNEDSTGITWDTIDDVMESEGNKFTWEINNDMLIHFYQMEISTGLIPKAYTITVLDLVNLEYHDEFGVNKVFVKIE